MYTVADAMRDVYLSNGIGTVDSYQTIYSGMELEPFLNSRRSKELAKKLGIREHSPVVGKIARLFELKGYDYLLQAAPKIVGKIPDVQFLIIGDGVLYDSIRKQIETLGLTENFVFAGLIDPIEMPDYIALMDIVAHLSLREGLPRAVVQALASGKPAVGFALDGTPEVIIDGKTGFLVKPGEAPAIADAIINLLKKPTMAKEMGNSGREFVKKQWDWRTMVQLLEDDYELLLRNAD